MSTRPVDHLPCSSTPGLAVEHHTDPAPHRTNSHTSSQVILRLVGLVDSLVNLAVLVVIVTLVMVSGYALWDTQTLFDEASAAQYEQYKPTRIPDGKQAFTRLQELNPDVIGWLSVHGTPIDYPLVQGSDDMHYVNTNALGKPAMSGSIFLAAANSPHFTDFNSIIYGHHMDKDAMFGPLDKYTDPTFFADHPSGNLYFDGADQGIEFFAFLHTNAYDPLIFTPAISGTDGQQKLLDHIHATATHTRTLETPVTVSDRLVMLTTCSGTSTNGRDILIGRLLNHPLADPYTDDEHNRGTGADAQAPWWTTTPARITLIGTLSIIGFALILTVRRKNNHAVTHKTSAHASSSPLTMTDDSQVKDTDTP